jgi:3-dehydroquinate synthase
MHSLEKIGIKIFGIFEEIIPMHPIHTAQSTVYFNDEGYQALRLLWAQKNYASVFLLMDENTHQHCLAPFMASLAWDKPVELIELPSGEQNKQLFFCQSVWEQLSELGADRKSLIINLGGGVITDMGGFIASCYKRGIDFVNVPTTLLSMVDASVGGKTGIDLGMLKNQIGVIAEPAMVIIDPQMLDTLDQRQWRSGLAEMLKHGLIMDASYWNQLKNIESFGDLIPLIHHSVALKAEVTSEDPTEQGLRKILNFGHTLGHAIESYFLENNPENCLLHGEAIAVGMIMEAYLSTVYTGLSQLEAEEIKNTLRNAYEVIDLPDTLLPDVFKIMQHDKKNSHGVVHFSLLNHIGKCTWNCPVDPEEVKNAFEFYQN